MCVAMQGLYKRLLVSGVVALVCALSTEVPAQTSKDVQTTTKPQIKAIQDDVANRSPAQQKMGSQLLDALKQSTTGTVVPNAPNLTAGPLMWVPEGVVVDITAKISDELIAAIQNLGGRVIGPPPNPKYGLVRAGLPLDMIEKLAERDDVQQVIPAVGVRKNGVVAREGDIAHAADIARTKYGVRGAGVKVGVISDSADDGYGALQKAFDAGALDPQKFTILEGQSGEGEGDPDNPPIAEGLAMAEIVHALAPDAQVIFATGYGGPSRMATNIEQLAKEGCQIIVDDLTYYNESPFQDGPISRAVSEVSAKGVLYFSSARNSGSKKHGTAGTWEGDFQDGGPAGVQFGAGEATGRIHVFATDGGGKRITLNTADTANRGDRVDLFWADPIGAAKNSYHVFVVDKKGNVVGSGTSETADPYQYVNRLRPGESIVIVKKVGSEDRFLHLDTGRAKIRYSTEGSVRGHNASGASNAFSVAAVGVPSPAGVFSANRPTSVEKFSSDGPRRMFFAPDGTLLAGGGYSASGGVVLRKPDITAANGISTTLPGNSGLNPFFGTSAAAPHAAAVAALLLSCKPVPSPDVVRRALESTALAIDGTIPNSNEGNGILMATDAAKPLCPVVQPTAPSEKAGSKSPE